MSRVVSSASRSSTRTPPSAIVCTESTKPWTASSDGARHHGRVAGADRAVGLAVLDGAHGDRQDQVLRAAATGEEVGEDQLGVELDDPHEQLVLAQRPDGADDALGDPVAARCRCRWRATWAVTTPAHSRVIRSPSSVGMSAQVR